MENSSLLCALLIAVFLLFAITPHISVSLLEEESSPIVQFQDVNTTLGHLSPGLVSTLDGSRNLTLRQQARRSRQINYCVNLLNYAGTYYPQSEVFPGPPQQRPPYPPNQYQSPWGGYPYPQYGPSNLDKPCDQRASIGAYTFTSNCHPPSETGPATCPKYSKTKAVYTGPNQFLKGCPAGLMGYCCCWDVGGNICEEVK
ncbi:uncharacterized protein LOC110855085 isoform X1 [Folsomia candida]|uniref:uncharacterized protein LOC110855085 isoform X1 n=1 Tax=Folsomia candida TaxID=158441 RepID=UPI001605321B|nr:uncharacterized protein LOC110855085 isoform X1 [Folsomia candida]